MLTSPQPWMKTSDLFPFDLDQLSWPVFVALVEAYFKAQNFRVTVSLCGASHAELLLYRNDSDKAFALIECCSGQQMIDGDQVTRLQRLMNKRDAMLGYLVTPGRLTDCAYALSVNKPIRLLSGNRLRVKIENLHEDLRRQVLNSIASAATETRCKDSQKSRYCCHSKVDPVHFDALLAEPA